MVTYGRIDIALDTTPFAGGTTSFDAFWMGVPLLTLTGERSPEEYIAIGLRPRLGSASAGRDPQRPAR